MAKRLFSAPQVQNKNTSDFFQHRSLSELHLASAAPSTSGPFKSSCKPLQTRCAPTALTSQKNPLCLHHHQARLPWPILTTSISLTHLLDYSRVKKAHTNGDDISTLSDPAELWRQTDAAQANNKERKSKQLLHSTFFPH